MVPITGRVSSFLEFFLVLKTPISIQNQIQIQSNPFFALLSSSVSRANLSCVVATIFSSLAFLSSSVSMANLSCLVAASFSSLALLSSSVSMANLSCLLATTFSSLRFLSNSFSSLRFNLLRVARRCFSWFYVSDDLFFSSSGYLVLLSCSIFFASYPQPFFPPFFSLCSVCLSFSFLSERFHHAKSQLNNPVWGSLHSPKYKLRYDVD